MGTLLADPLMPQSRSPKREPQTPEEELRGECRAGLCTEGHRAPASQGLAGDLGLHVHDETFQEGRYQEGALTHNHKLSTPGKRRKATPSWPYSSVVDSRRVRLNTGLL